MPPTTFIPAEHPKLKHANPLVVFHKREPSVERFCRAKRIAFEVVEGRIDYATRKVRELAKTGKHSSVMLSEHMPAMTWVLELPKIKRAAAASDIPYMLYGNGNVSLPVCRIPHKHNAAIAHLKRFFEPVDFPEKPKITIFCALPQIERIPPNVMRALLRNPSNGIITLIRILPEGVKIATPKGEIDWSAIERAVSDSKGVPRDLCLALSLFRLLRDLKSGNLDVLAMPSLSDDRDDLNHLAHSAIVLTLDHVIREKGLYEAVHGSGEGIYQENGAPILRSRDIGNIAFSGYPLFWLGGCHSAASRIRQAVFHSGCALVGNSNYGYRSRWLLERKRDSTGFYSTDLHPLYDGESRAIGLMHVKLLQLVKDSMRDGIRFGHKILNNEPMTVPADNRYWSSIYILNRSQFWGNCEMPSALYFATHANANANARANG